MIFDELLHCLATRSVELHLAGDRLRYRAPEGALNADLRNQIDRHRPAIIEHLRSAGTAARGGRQRCGNCDRRTWVDDPPKDGRIRTTCGKCGGFIGYRRADQRMT